MPSNCAPVARCTPNACATPGCPRPGGVLGRDQRAGASQAAAPPTDVPRRRPELTVRAGGRARARRPGLRSHHTALSDPHRAAGSSHRSGAGYSHAVSGDRRIALVTGASRGIGKASAIALARSGFDVAITARTVREGEAIDESGGTGADAGIPGSLDTTAGEIEAAGVRALAIRADLLDRGSLLAAVDGVLDAWGRIDVLVNNAVHTGPGAWSASSISTSTRHHQARGQRRGAVGDDQGGSSPHARAG